MKYVDRIEEAARRLRDETQKAGRVIWLAGLGAAGVMENTGRTLFETLVDEGRRFQDRELGRVRETANRATSAVGDAARRVEEAVQQASKAALARIGMPSRSDIAALTARVEQLTARVETLSRKEAAHAG
jgi:poly(hydroxyalkanoate) granule-associated protein